METPSTIGRYEVIERVGRGGMGLLYRGRDPVLDREVAIKVMAGDFSTDESARAALLSRGARRRPAAAPKHRHNLRVRRRQRHAVHRDGVPARAEPRAADAEQPPLTLVRSSTSSRSCCTGLHYAHEQGIVHRDVKPAEHLAARRRHGEAARLRHREDRGVDDDSAGRRARQRVLHGAGADRRGARSTAAPTSSPAGVVLYELLASTAVRGRFADGRDDEDRQRGPAADRQVRARICRRR